MTERKHKRLTVEQLKTFKGFENYTEEQAEETIKTLETLSIVFYRLFSKEKIIKKKITIIKNNKHDKEQPDAA